MLVRFALRRADYRIYARFVESRFFRMRREITWYLALAVWLLCLGLTYWFVHVYGNLSNWWTSASWLQRVVPIAGVILPLVVLTAPTDRRARRQASLGGKLGSQELTWSQESVAWSRAGIRTEIPWRELHGIETSGRQAYLVLGVDRGNVDCIVVPRSAFPSPAAFDAFLAEARRLWAAARAKVAK